MITPATESRIRSLLEDRTRSLREVARLAGVSPGTVKTIAVGKRPDYELRRRLRRELVRKRRGLRQRCTNCGAMVYMPCVRCHTQAEVAKNSQPSIVRLFESLDGPLGVGLRGAHRKRYEEVRANKLRRRARRNRRLEHQMQREAKCERDDWNEPQPQQIGPVEGQEGFDLNAEVGGTEQEPRALIEVGCGENSRQVGTIGKEQGLG